MLTEIYLTWHVYGDKINFDTNIDSLLTNFLIRDDFFISNKYFLSYKI